MKVIKKIVFLGLACLTLISPLSLTVSAELLDKSLPRVVDDADLLTENEEKSLESQIKAITDKYDFDIVLVTADTLGGKTPTSYADDYYDYNGYGANKERDGVLLLVSMEDRDWWITTRGYGITVFNDVRIDNAGENFVSHLSSGEYSKGFECFLSDAEEYIELTNSGKTKSDAERMKELAIYISASFGVGLIAAVITVLIFRAQLKSVKFQGGAAHYEVAGSLNLTRSNDVFLYKNISKTRRVESNGGGRGSGGGSSTHISSSGATHGGGGGKF